MITFNHYPVPGTLTIKGITGKMQIIPLFSLVPSIPSSPGKVGIGMHTGSFGLCAQSELGWKHKIPTCQSLGAPAVSGQPLPGSGFHGILSTH